MYDILESSEQKTETNSRDLYDNDVPKDIFCPTCNKILHIDNIFENVKIICSTCNSDYTFKEHSPGHGFELTRVIRCKNCNALFAIPLSDKTRSINCGICHHKFWLMPDGSQQPITPITDNEAEERPKRKLFKWFKK